MEKTKAQIEHLTTYILIIVVALVLFMILMSFASSSKSITDDQACKLSVRVASIPTPPGTGKFAEINCPTRQVTVKNNGIWKASLRTAEYQSMTYDQIKKEMQSRGLKVDDQKEVLRWMGSYALASEMESCWSNMGEGKLSPFVSSLVFSDRKCVVCDVVRFDDSFLKEVDSQPDFNQWLKDNKRLKGENNFYDYLLPTKGEITTRGWVSAGAVSPLALTPPLGTIILGSIIYEIYSSKTFDNTVSVKDILDFRKTSAIAYAQFDKSWSTTLFLSDQYAKVAVWQGGALPCESLF